MKLFIVGDVFIINLIILLCLVFLISVGVELL